MSRLPPPPAGYTQTTPDPVLDVPPPPAGFSLLPSPESRLRISAMQAAPISPDQQAEILMLSRRTGIPPSIIQGNLDAIKQKAEITAIDYQRMLHESPKTAGFLMDSTNAAVTKDDHHTLTFMEALYGVLQSNIAANITMTTARRAAAGLAQIAPAGLGLLETRLKATIAEESAHKKALADAGIPQPDTPLLDHYRAAMTSQLESARRFTGAIVDAVRGPQNPSRLIEYPLQAVESMAQMAEAGAVGLVAGPEAALGFMGAMQAGQTGPAMIDKGADPTKALLFSGLSGIAEAGFEVLPMHIVVEQLKLGGPVAKFMIKELGAEVATEEPTTLFQDFFDWAADPENKDKSLKDYVHEHDFMGPAVQTLAVTVLSALGVGGITAGISRHLHNQSPQQVFLEQEGEAVKDSPTAKRSPETMAAAVTDLVAGTGAEQRYVAPEKIRERAAALKIAPGDLAATLTENGRAKYEEAARQGTDVEIPAADYATKVGASDHGAFFAPTTRVGSPEMANAEEADAMREAALADLTPEEMAQQETIQANIAQLESPELGPAIDAALENRTVFHGSPHEFEQFDLSKVGTGEGAQAFGHGLYFAEHPSTAEYYRTSLTKKLSGVEVDGVPLEKSSLSDSAKGLASLIADNPGGRFSLDAMIAQNEASLAKAEAELAQHPQSQVGDANARMAHRTLAALNELKGLDIKSVGKPQGGFYAVKIPEVAIGKMLDWDKPLSEQPRTVKDALAAIDPDMWSPEGADYDPKEQGSSIYQRLKDIQSTRLRQEDAASGVVRPWVTLGEKAASEQLAAAGVPGIKYFDQSSRDVQEGTSNFVVFDPSILKELSSSVKEPDVLDRLEAQARRRIRERGTRLGAGIPIDEVADWVIIGSVKIARGVRNFAAWSSEMIAEYGPQLRPYLRALYVQSVGEAARRLSLAPEAVREAGASIAVDAAVTDAEDNADVAPLITSAAAVGWTDERFAQYEARMQEAAMARREKIQREFRKSFARMETAVYQERRAATEATVTAELNVDRDQQAVAYLQKGTLPNGEALPDATPRAKLDQAALEERYKKHKDSPEMQALRRLDAYRQKGGQHPDLVAERLGYASGDAMVQAVIAAPKFDDAVQAETDRRMQAEYGDPVTDGSLDDRAREAAMTIGRAEIAQEEMRALLEAMKESGLQSVRDIKALSVKEARASAERQVRDTAVRNLNPRLHYAAARKAKGLAREAFAKDNMQAAFQESNRELMNVELYRAHRQALDRIEEARSAAKAYFRDEEQLAKTRAMAFVEGARAIAAQLFFPGRAASVEAAMKLIKEHDPAMHEMVELQLPEIEVKDWSQAPYQVVSDQIDIAENLWKQSRRDKQARSNLELIDRNVITAELKEKLTPMSKRFLGMGETGLTPTMQVFESEGVLVAAAWLTRMESWVTLMDGGPTGPYRTYLLNPIMEATTKFRLARNDFYARYLELRKPIEDTLTKAKIAAPELNYTWGNDGSGGKSELLGALLHTGNRKKPTSNMVKYLLSRGWGFYEQNGEFNTTKWDQFIRRMEDEGVLTKKDYDFNQGVWDLFDAMKPDLQKAHLDRYGFPFEETPADAFTNQFGTYRGGYVPVILDAIASKGVASARAEKQMTFEADTAVALPSVGRANTISRVVTGEDFKVAAGLGFIPQHIDWALRFSYIQPVVWDVAKIMKDRSFRDVLDAHNPAVAHEMVIPWLSRTAQQRVTKKGEWTFGDRALSELRGRTSLQFLAGAVGNTLQQFTGYFQVLQKLHRKRYAVRAALSFVRHPIDTVRYVGEKSDYMRSHVNGLTTELQTKLHTTLANASLLGRGVDFVNRNALILQEVTQGLVNTLGWTASYNDALRQHYDDHSAVLYADSVIRETQGSQAPESISRLEASHPWVKIFNFFSGYPSMNLNLMTVETMNAYRNNTGMVAVASRVATSLGLTWLLPSIVGQMVLNWVNVGDPWDDDDDDTHVDEALNLLIGSPVKTAFSMIPIAGGFGVAAMNAAFTSSRYDDDVRLSPSAQIFQSAIDDIPKLMKIRNVEDLTHLLTTDKKIEKDMLTILGVFAKLPLGAPWIARPLGYMMDVSAGKARPEGPVDVALGLIRGREVRRGRR